MLKDIIVLKCADVGAELFQMSLDSIGKNLEGTKDMRGVERLERRVHSKEELKNLFMRIRDEIEEFNEEQRELAETLKGYDTIFLYGAGTDGRVIAENLWSVLQDKEVYFLDKNTEKHEKEIYKGIVCKPVEAAYGYGEHGAIVLTSSLYADEIKFELMKASMQTVDKFLGMPIMDRYCQILIKQKEKQMLLDNQEAFLHFHELLAEYTIKCDLYEIVWNVNYAKQFVYRAQETMKENLDTREQFGSYMEAISVREGKTIIGGYLVENILVRTKEFWEAAEQVEVYELNRVFSEQLKEKYSDSSIRIHYGGLGEKTEIISYDRYDGVYGHYGYLDFISDEDVPMYSLDEEELSSGCDCTEKKEKVDLVILRMINAETAALKGMKRLLARNRPALMLDGFGGHWLNQEEFTWNIACLLDSWGLEYRFVYRNIHRLGGFLCAIPKERL